MHGILALHARSAGTEHEFGAQFVVADGRLLGSISGSMRVEREGRFGMQFEMTAISHGPAFPPGGQWQHEVWMP